MTSSKNGGLESSGSDDGVQRRLALFDIDGTLIRVPRGVSDLAVEHAFERVLGLTGAVARCGEFEFHGKTDRQIFMEICEALEIEREEAARGLVEFDAALLEGWERHLEPSNVQVLPGVVDLLDRLKGEGVMLGLLTGNIREGARAKLEHHGLYDYFPFGAFGCDSSVRDELPPFALKRAGEHHGVTVAADQAVIIGDSHRDVACAKAWNIRVLAVATGALSVERLRDYDPDQVVETLSDTDSVVGFIAG